ncbi:hypothetical protein MASR2M48_18760 [Spirochaetota bacterium]
MGRDRVVSDKIQLVQAAYTIIDTSGFKKFSTRKLAKTMGISHMTVYNYMSRDDLLNGIIVMGFAELEDRYMPRVETCNASASCCKGILCIAQELLAFANDHPNLYHFMFQERLNLNNANPDILNLYRSATNRVLATMPDENRDAIRADAYLFFVLTNGLILGHLGRRHSTSYEQCKKNIDKGFSLLLGHFAEEDKDPATRASIASRRT